MAKVIKGQKPTLENAKPADLAIPKTGGRIIERDVFRAQQQAAEILKNGEAARKQKVLEGKRHAAQAKEEAMVRGALEAFAVCAKEAILMFRRRAKRCADAEGSIKTLAKELVEKILGAPPTVSGEQVDQIYQRGLSKLLAQRKLKLQIGQGRLSALTDANRDLFSKLTTEPDLEVEEATDLRPGFVRIVTDVGSAMCAEQVALDAFLSHSDTQ